MTVISRNPVHSVLWLILAFLSSAGLFVLLGAEFLAMLLIIVYVGAVAVLFLFVVMMLDVDFSTLKAEMAGYLPIALLIAVVLVMQLTSLRSDFVRQIFYFISAVRTNSSSGNDWGHSSNFASSQKCKKTKYSFTNIPRPR